MSANTLLWKAMNVGSATNKKNIFSLTLAVGL